MAASCKLPMEEKAIIIVALTLYSNCATSLRRSWKITQALFGKSPARRYIDRIHFRIGRGREAWWDILDWDLSGCLGNPITRQRTERQMCLLFTELPCVIQKLALGHIWKGAIQALLAAGDTIPHATFCSHFALAEGAGPKPPSLLRGVLGGCWLPALEVTCCSPFPEWWEALWESSWSPQSD